MNARTVARPVARSSAGIHSGAACVARLCPAPFGTGVIFRTVDGDVPAQLAFAEAVPGATRLARGSARVDTPEHLLAAVCALGVTDLLVELGGPEVPALDGSAQGWVEALDEAGRVDGPPLSLPEVVAAEVAAAGGVAWIGPGARIAVEVDFGADGPRGSLAGPLTEAFFRAEIARARTFVLARDVERLRASGRGRGATAANTRVWSPGDPADEPVRHKLLDAWGDLALLGPAAVALRVVRGSHALHHAVLRAGRARAG